MEMELQARVQWTPPQVLSSRIHDLDWEEEKA
jgi:hypothetical protein